MNARIVARWALGASLLGGCNRSTAPDATPPVPAAGQARPTGEASAVAPPESVPIASVSTAEEQPLLGVPGDENDAGGQGDTPRVEEVYAALEKAGVTVGERKAMVATVFGAKRCLTARAGARSSLAVCEYATEAAADAGRSATSRTLGPGARVLLRKRTTLAIQQRGGGAADDVLIAKVASAFAKL